MHLTFTEQIVIRYFEKNPNKILVATIRQLAKLTCTSTGSIERAVKKWATKILAIIVILKKPYILLRTALNQTLMSLKVLKLGTVLAKLIYDQFQFHFVFVLLGATMQPERKVFFML